MNSSHEESPSSLLSRPSRSALRLRRSFGLTAAIVCGLALPIACGDDSGDDDGGVAGDAGAGGSSGGSAGAAGAGGSSAGAAGAAGAAGSSGAAGAAGAAGAGSGPIAADGVITVLSADADALKTPTTTAVRGEDLWVVNGQLGALLTPDSAPPELPFSLVSVPLAGGNVGAEQIELPGDAFFPEGIAAAEDGTLFVGSVNLGTIVRVEPESTDAQVFVDPGVATRGVVGLAVDADNNVLWFCDSSPVAGRPGADLVGVDIDTGDEIVRHELPDPVAPGQGADAGVDPDAGVEGDAGGGDGGVVAGPTTFCNDLIVSSSGDVFATDSSGRIFRIDQDDLLDPDSAEVWLDDPALAVPGSFGANGIDEVGNNLIVAVGGSLVAVNPRSNNPASSIRVLTLSENGAAATLCGPDGLQTVPGSDDELIVIENGFCAEPRERVVKVTLDL